MYRIWAIISNDGNQLRIASERQQAIIYYGGRYALTNRDAVTELVFLNLKSYFDSTHMEDYGQTF